MPLHEKEELSRLVGSFLEYLRNVRNYSKTTVEAYRIALSQMLDHALVSHGDEGWRIDLAPYRITIAKLSKKSIALKLSAIHSFTRFLREQLEVEVKLLYDQSIKVPKTLPKPIDQSYITEVLEHAELPVKLAVTMLYGLGLRISELGTVELANIESGWIRVRGKGNKERQLPLIPSLEKEIKIYLDRYRPVRYLFEKDGEPLKSSQLRYIVSKAFAGRGIKATPHQLRHAFASHLLREGARISDISELLGHKSMASTQIYTKLEERKKLESYLAAHPLAQGKPDDGEGV